jgi:cytochrome P450
MRRHPREPARYERTMALMLSQLPISPWVFPDALRFFEELQTGAEPVATVQIAGSKAFYLRDPVLIGEMLAAHAPDFHKSRGIERAKALLGEGLITSEGQLHRQQRKLIQPIFHHRNLKNFGVIIRARARQRAESWRTGQILNLSEEMYALTQVIIGEALFGTEVGDRTSRVSQLMETIIETFFLYLGHPMLKQAADARREFKEIVQTMIEERRKSTEVRSDLLTLLFAAQDPETGFAMSDEQLQDEVITLFLAGHETTANALGWTIYLLTQHPEIAERVALEVRSAETRSGLGEGINEDSLLFRIIRESLRLYPPAWAIGRRAANDLQIGGITIPKGAIVLACQWAMHRSGRYFSRPTRFDPDRWTPEFQCTLPKYAFFPFGAGPRSCIGERFAWMELGIVLNELLCRWRFERVPGQTIKPRPAITLRPNKPIHVRAVAV